MANLTVRKIESLKPGAVAKEYPDGSGLYFNLQPSGKASWTLRYRHGGKSRKVTIGPYPDIGLKDARERASKLRVAVNDGADPAAEKKARRTPDKSDLVETVTERFISREVSKMRPSWAHEAERMLRKEIVEAWRGRCLSEIRKTDIHVMLDAIMDRPAPIVANRVFSILRRLCNWAIERGTIEASPCAGIKPPAAERSRDRVLSDDELVAVWRASDAISWPFGPLVQLLILTGQRRDEVASMQWSEIDIAARLWTLPPKRTKNGVAHIVPLSDIAVTILECLPRIKGKEKFVFTSNGATAVSGFSRAKVRIDSLVPDLPVWRLHDLRRTTASGMAGLGIDIHIVEKLLNHVSGSFSGIVGVYQKHDFAKEKRIAMEAWSRHLDSLVNCNNG